MELKKLYWKSDKEKLLQIMQHLNPKYLIGLYEKLGGISDEGIPYYGDEDEMFSPRVIVKYDGCQFTTSRKQLRKELVRRGLIRQMDFSSSIHQDGSTRKWGVKNYKITFKVEEPNGITHLKTKIKSGKEIGDIECETKVKKV